MNINKQRYVSKQQGAHWMQEMVSPNMFPVEGVPTSGTSGNMVGAVNPGGLVLDTLNGVVFVNEGTLLSPYFTPITLDQRPLFGVQTDWRDGVGVAHAGSAAGVLVAGSGVRIFGQGAAENDSGAVAQTAGEGGTAMRLTTTNEASHTINLGMAAGVMQPDQHQLLVVDCIFTNVTAITLRNVYCGFIGTAADALDPPVTGATVTATLVQDDLVLGHFDVGYTDGDRWYFAYNKSNAAATLAPPVDTSTNVPAAGTYQRVRMEVAADGDAIFFLDKVQVATQAIALDVDEECTPVFGIESTSTAVKAVDVKQFGAWAYR